MARVSPEALRGNITAISLGRMPLRAGGETGSDQVKTHARSTGWGNW